MYVLAVFLLPIVAVALVVRPRWRLGLRERLGGVPATEPGRPAIWIHGASVGEVTALAPIVRNLRRELPSHRLVVSTLTLGGRDAAAARLPEADARILFPLDAPWIVRRALAAVTPCLVLFSETELWPNFLDALATRGIPAIMVSGRVSARAFERYRRWRTLFAPALAGVRVFCVQSLESARRLVALGAPPSRIVVTGSVKAAALDGAAATDRLSLMRLGAASVPVLVAGSTHAGEEEAVLAAFDRVRAVAPSARLVLAPRKPERFEEVAALLRARGARFVRRSELVAGASWPVTAPVVLLDSLGELAALYPGARAAFVGGTLVPVGGHNVLEPAAAGVPVVFGPHTEHAGGAAARLVAAGGAVEVGDADALARVLVAWFTVPEEARRAGERARAVIAASDGAVAVTLAVIRGVLAESGAAARRA
ncbi:MAG: 3-deoxy-D-manno-octulosonic acid transferase [Deltaproteobacteria bacterium]|nr:3-deoxy-D-manno-octulosonic acid transferase [Deltaproteobacteria bacterium]